MKRSLPLAVASVLFLALSACSRGSQNEPSTPAATPQEKKAAQLEENNDRQQLDQIPPPSKSRYLAIHTRESWANPFLVVGRKTVAMRMMYPEGPQASALPGTMLHPAGARRRDLTLRLSELPEALAALPEDAWPYGRVIALEEDPAAPRADRIQVRRNVETTIQVLNDLGVVVYEWPPNGALR
ncbi:hypothetical protein [Silvibacterium dinghuense]|uniref:Uncharacterized protein n=1 Tax=Silvibacterium dinghuense TaxID=1560006 RepID=A0A4Q1SIJ3_9BACT|nr:hypothetical protein [Silvibacterium dinghuense]RXS97050.1 hypothetical protein ESZ00_03735 [Silvibacterium dinghuense]